MQFDKEPEANICRITFEDKEPEIVASALYKSLFAAATEAAQLSPGNPLTHLGRALITPDGVVAAGFGSLDSEHLEALTASVEESTADMSPQASREAGVFIERLHEARKALAGDAIFQRRKPRVLKDWLIASIVCNVTVPDYPPDSQDY